MWGFDCEGVRFINSVSVENLIDVCCASFAKLLSLCMTQKSFADEIMGLRIVDVF